ARLRLAAAEDTFDERQRHERSHDVRRRSDGEDVDVAAGFDAAPDAADRDELDIRGAVAQIADDSLHRLDGVGQQMALLMPPALLECAQQQLLLLRAHSLEGSEAAG